MADVIPFRGIRYNPDMIDDMSKVVAPPYDVIPPAQQIVLHERHLKNVVRLILGQQQEDDGPGNNRYTRAAAHFEQWQTEQTLIRDDAPTFYITSVEFKVNGKTVTRYGLTALVGLEPFEKGIILPHEKTFSKVKSERLELMKECHANFSPIFSLYSDENRIFDTLRTAIADQSPVMDILDDKNERHKCWCITDPAIHQKIIESMKSQRLFIADGHHRYETALNYRDWVAQNTPDFDSNHPANYIMMYLCSMEDPGLIILPAHRMLKQVPETDLNRFCDKAAPYFDITTAPLSGVDHKSRGEVLTSKMAGLQASHVIGVYIRNKRVFHSLILKPHVMEELFADELDEALRGLDVSILTRLIFLEILGFDQARLDNESLIAYSSNAQVALEAIDTGEYDIAFLLNPTKTEQVQQIAQKRLTMPRKTTYFYPKVLSGQIFNSLKR